METKSGLEAAASFLYANGRLLDRRRFEYHFAGGRAEDVLAALRAYQNEDGGFGHALEPDIRCPHSQPVPTEMALALMDEIGVADADILAGIVRYLRSIAVRDTGGFPLAFLPVNDYPHAPWWTIEDDSRASLNPTGRIIGLLMKQPALEAVKEEAWFRQAAEFVWSRIGQPELQGFHDLIQRVTFLEHVPDRDRAEPLLEQLNRVLQQPGVIELDPHAEGYVHKALDWAPTPESYCARFINPEDIRRHLDALEEGQQEDGGWTISWQAVSAACELEWRGSVTVDRLLTLRNFGRLPRS